MLKPVDSYTAGGMLITVESIDKFIELFKIYHAKRRNFLMENVPEYYNRETLPPYGPELRQINDKHYEFTKQFIEENNCKPFDFEFSLGCAYIRDENFEFRGYQYDVMITDQKDILNSWFIVKEFMSDLPEGTHYLQVYCA